LAIAGEIRYFLQNPRNPQNPQNPQNAQGRHPAQNAEDETPPSAPNLPLAASRRLAQPSSRRFAASRATTFAPLRGDRRFTQPPSRPTTVTFKIGRFVAVNLQFLFKKNLYFSSKTIVLGADLGAHVFLFFYNNKCSQFILPDTGEIAPTTKKEKQTQKTSFFELNYFIFIIF
jgi:hypothetical protein